MTLLKQLNLGVGLFVLLSLLIACSEEAALTQRLRDYAEEQALLGLYGEKQYDGVHMGYVYDTQKDQILILLQQGSDEEVYVLREASIGLEALMVREDQTGLEKLHQGKTALLEALKPQLQADVQAVWGVQGRYLNPRAEARDIQSCQAITSFIERLLCLLEEVLGNATGGTATGPSTFTGDTGTSGGTGIASGGEGEPGEGSSTSGGADSGQSTTASNDITGGATTGSTTGGTTSGNPNDGGAVSGVEGNARIYGRVWFDKDLNQGQSDTEPNLEGFTVYLDLNNNDVLDVEDLSTVTNSEGEYVFTGLTSGERYTVREVLPIGWTNHYVGQELTRTVAVPRIVNGESTSIQEHPYMISMRNSVGACGASLITPSIAMTAAHCVSNLSGRLLGPSSFVLRLESSRHNSGGRTVRVERLVRHPSFNSRVLHNDIALLRLATPVPHVPRVFLPDPVEDARLEQTSQPAFVIGWGLLRDKGRQVPATLRKANLLMIDADTCRKRYRGVSASLPPANSICAGDTNKDTCQGDSGGPLYAVKQVATHDVRHIQLGIVSGGIGCNHPRYPGYYASVTKLMPYIERYVKPEPSQELEIVLVAGDNHVHFANFH